MTHLDNEAIKHNNNGGQSSQHQEKRKLEEQETQGSDLDTFWTVCPFCYFVFEYKKMYQDCCLRCQKCMLAFQAVAIQVPRKVEGKDQYYCCVGGFPVKYDCGKECKFERKAETLDVGVKKKRRDVQEIDVIEISDSDGENGVDEVGKGQQGSNLGIKEHGATVDERVNAESLSDVCGNVIQGNGTSWVGGVARKPMKNVKIVPRRPKKNSGTGVRLDGKGSVAVAAVGSEGLKVNCERGSGSGSNGGGREGMPSGGLNVDCERGSVSNGGGREGMVGGTTGGGEGSVSASHGGRNIDELQPLNCGQEGSISGMPGGGDIEELHFFEADDDIFVSISDLL